MSGDAISIIKDSWNPSTFRQYSSYIKQWLSYCQQGNISPVEWSIRDGINFLTKLFTEKGLGYSAMNTARSALSVIMHNPDGSTFGNNHLVKNLFISFIHSFFIFIFYFLSTVAPSICIDCFTGGRAKIHIISKFKT